MKTLSTRNHNDGAPAGALILLVFALLSVAIGVCMTTDTSVASFKVDTNNELATVLPELPAADTSVTAEPFEQPSPDEATSEPENLATAEADSEAATPAEPAVVTDYSYFRLARQGKAVLIPGLDVWLDDPSTNEPLPATLELSGHVNVTYRLTDEQLALAPGTVISQIQSDKIQSVISVPVLPAELQNFLQKRGERAVMVYNTYTGGELIGSTEVKVMFCYGGMEIWIDTEFDIGTVSPTLDEYHNRTTCLLYHSVYPSEQADQMTLVSDYVAYYVYFGEFAYNFEHHNLYSSVSYYAQNAEGEIISGEFDELGIAQCTETSFRPSAPQLSLLLAGIIDSDAMPIPDKYLPTE